MGALAWLLIVGWLDAGAQLRVSSPYLDVVSRYRSGDYAKAVDEMAGFPVADLRNRARRDLLDLTCQVLAGTADCKRAREEKPTEFARVVDVWTTMVPPAAGLHIDAAVVAQAQGKPDAAEAHRIVALELAELLEAQVPADLPGRERRMEVRRRVGLVSLWLQQLRFELMAIEAPLARARQAFPTDALLALALGSLHEVRARPHALVEASKSRQGNLATWRREERVFRLESAAKAYREALALDKNLAEAHLRLGRVLSLQGKTDEALAALARVGETTEDMRWKYLAVMFRGAVAESQAQPEAAREAYAEALRLWPSSQPARLAISLGLAGSGDWDGARALLTSLEPAGDSRRDDPWWAYDFGQAWRIESELAEIRRVVSR